MMIDLFGNEFRIMESALAAREQAQGVHAANIANADTPNYRADRRSFADFLQARLRELPQAGGVAPVRTRPGHLAAPDAPASGLFGGRSPMQASAGASGALTRMDGNTVDMQKEMAAMSENQLMHELTLRLLKDKLGGLARVIKEAR